MTKPTIKDIDSYTYMTQEKPHENHSGVVQCKPTRHGRVRLLVGGDAAYMDMEEAIKVCYSLVNACRIQWDEFPVRLEMRDEG